MGIYFNPGNELFKRMVSADIYIDKSMLIAETNKMLNTTSNYICMSRPRRFGKTMAGNMLVAYYSKGCDSAELFAGLKISKDPSYEENKNQYDVIYIDLNSEYQNTPDKDKTIKNLQEKIKDEIEAEMGCLTKSITEIVFEMDY